MGVIHYAPPVSGGEMSGIADKIIEAMPKTKTSNEVASDAKFTETFGKSQKENLLKAFVCREGQTFNVYWYAIAEAALPLYGDKDTQYIKILINDKLNKEKFLEVQFFIE